MKPEVPEIRTGDLGESKNTAAVLNDENSATSGTIDSTTLMRGGRQLTITHGNERYQLRVTTNDKLILTK